MREVWGAIALIASMWAGQAQAAYITYTFEASGYGDLRTWDEITHISYGVSGYTLATFWFTVDDADASELYSTGGGTAAFSIGKDNIYANYSLLGGHGYAREGYLSAAFAPDTLGPLPGALGAPAIPTLSAIQLYTSGEREASSFRGRIDRVTATVSSDPFPYADFVIGTPVPEPASWAMLIAGFGLVGGAARRSRYVWGRPALKRASAR